MAAYDVAIVGASIGGCTAARLYGLAGLRVALIERRPDPAAYKVTCTHAILSSAVPTMERVGIAPLIDARGAVRTHPAAWSAHGGWMRLPTDVPHGYGVTRQTLDPLLRQLAAETPGVELITGSTAVGLTASNGRPAGVETERPDHSRKTIPAKLVVGADGRDSHIARLARVPGRVRPHNRFFYFAYWRGVRPAGTTMRVWILDPDGAAQFPNEDGVTVLVATYHRARLAEVRADPEAAYARALTGLPDGPDLENAERISKLLGKLEVPNVMRPAARPGLAFVGDAALASDPLFGVGLSFAFQSAAWLADETSAVLGDARALDAALRRYRRRFAWRLWPHHLQMAEFSTARPLTPLERLTFRRAATDPQLARTMGEVLIRERSPFALLDPRAVARLLPRRRN